MNEKKRKKLAVLNSIKEFDNKIYGRTYLQKLFYLLNEEKEFELFDYKNHYFGPFSEDLNSLLTELVIEGKLSEEKISTKNHECYVYEVTPTGKRFLTQNSSQIGSDLKNTIKDFKARFQKFTPTELLKYVYKNHPETTEKSVFGQDIDFN